MNSADKISTVINLKIKIQQWKANGDQVVFTNGCFDILHLGHIDYLEKAAQKGDKLIIGLNTDDSVKRLKGEERPVNNEYARARILSALSFVDAVITFGEDTPYKLIQELLPTTLVKGSDYLAEDIVGADIVIASGGSVETIDLVDGYSTTNLINKLKN
jgi:rfaE bifunctional protein nucleotidyltransferase chain/domain